MKQTVTLYIHRNLDFCESNKEWESEFVIYPFDGSNSSISNLKVIGTQVVEVEIPAFDLGAIKKAKYEAQMAAIEKDAENAKKELKEKFPELAIGSEVAA